MVNSTNFDVCIIGAGMIGASAALGLAKQGLTVCVVELKRPSSFDHNQAPDLRVSALNHSSLDFLKKHAVWSEIQQMRYRNYSQLSTWESKLNVVNFHASDISQDYLGAFVENRVLQLALLNVIERDFTQQISLEFNKQVVNVDHINGKIRLDNDATITAKLIIGADGANSIVRRKAGIGTSGWDYKQLASLISIECEHEFDECTWQHFTPTGPLAFLPMHARYASLVWYADKQQTEMINQASLAELSTMISKHFPSRLGRFSVLDKAYFPLKRMHAQHYYLGKTVLIGDAAHTINPLAGQGVNLGFKDVICLCEKVTEFGLEEMGLLKALRAYEKTRKPQNLLMMSAMDAIYGVFSNDNPIAKVLRSAGLGLADKAGVLKVQALKYAVGLQ